MDTWWPLDKADDDSWIIVYYCGVSSGWNYKGGLVLSKLRMLTESEEMMVEESFFNAIGLKLADFCKPDTSLSCQDGK